MHTNDNELEHWLLQYIEDHEHSDLVPLTKKRALGDYPQFDFIYDFSSLQKLLNLNTKTGSFTGVHSTTDFLVDCGKVVDFFSFNGKKDHNGSFIEFYSSRLSPDITKLLALLPGYVGFLNVEYIGDHLTKASLCPSLCFFDICGGFISNGLDYIYSGVSNLSVFVDSYQKLFRTPFDVCITIPSKSYAEIPDSISSLQLTFYPDCRLSDNEGDGKSFLYMCINGFDLKDIDFVSKQMQGFMRRRIPT